MINSTVKNEKKINATIYSFDANNEHFTANYIYGKKPRFELFHNGSLIGSSEQLKTRSEFTINTEYEALNITVWLEQNNFAAYIGKLNGIGIEVNKNPVQNTLADPEVYVKYGRSGLFILLFILTVKSIFNYYQIYKAYESHLVSIISDSVYVIPLILVALMAIFYKRWTMFALIAGIAISILEFTDYAIALPGSLPNTNIIMVILWIFFRVSVILILFNALKWKRKSKNMN